jgi:hypothetical protein
VLPRLVLDVPPLRSRARWLARRTRYDRAPKAGVRVGDEAFWSSQGKGHLCRYAGAADDVNSIPTVVSGCWKNYWFRSLPKAGPVAEILSVTKPRSPERLDDFVRIEAQSKELVWRVEKVFT